jgi:hypothetical protein
MNQDFMPSVPEVPPKEIHEPLLREEYEAMGGKGQYDRGVLSSHLSEWSEFYSEVRRFRGRIGYVWRGQEQHGDGWTPQVPV